MSISFDQQNVLITGASRGLGQAIAYQFAQRGAHLFLVARTNKDLQQLKNDLEKISPQQQITIISVDLAEPNACHFIFDKVMSACDGIDILINNAAIQGPIGKTWAVDWTSWQGAFQINFFAAVQLMRLCAEKMIEKNYGKIINLSGGGATSPRPYFTSYASAKGALVNFSESFAKEVQPYHIDVNCIAPGVMNTALLAEVANAGIRVAGEKEFNIAKEYAGKADTMQKAAALCVFLGSKQSDGITGKLISAVWDSWQGFVEIKEELKNSDLYTMRRVIP